MKNLQSRLARLERLVLLKSSPPTLSPPTLAVNMEHYMAHPEGPALLMEYYQVIAREAAMLSPGFHQSLLRQRLLQDDRARGIAARLAEIGGGLDFPYESDP